MLFMLILMLRLCGSSLDSGAYTNNGPQDPMRIAVVIRPLRSSSPPETSTGFALNYDAAVIPHVTHICDQTAWRLPAERVKSKAEDKG